MEFDPKISGLRCVGDLTDLQHWWSYRITYRYNDQEEDDEQNMIQAMEKLREERNVLFLACREDADKEVARTHSHILFYTGSSSIGIKRALERFQKTHDVTGGNARSAGKNPGDVEKAIKYICKGIDIKTQPNIICNSLGVDIKRYHDQYWETNIECAQNKLKAERKKKDTWTQSLVKDFEWPMDEPPNMQNAYHRVFVLEHVLNWYGQDMKGFDEPILNKACNAIWNKIAGGHKSQLLIRLYDKIYGDAHALEAYGYDVGNALRH